MKVTLLGVRGSLPAPMDNDEYRQNIRKILTIGLEKGIKSEDQIADFMKELIAFARALYRDPPLLILDEPTASIDSDTETKLQRAMDTATSGPMMGKPLERA